MEIIKNQKLLLDIIDFTLYYSKEVNGDNIVYGAVSVFLIKREGDKKMDRLNEIVATVDDFVWGPVMLVLLVGTGIFLTIRTGFLPWRNLPYAIKSTLSKEARTQSRGEGDVSPFSALTTALAATIGTSSSSHLIFCMPSRCASGA